MKQLAPARRIRERNAGGVHLNAEWLAVRKRRPGPGRYGGCNGLDVDRGSLGYNRGR